MFRSGASIQRIAHHVVGEMCAGKTLGNDVEFGLFQISTERYTCKILRELNFILSYYEATLRHEHRSLTVDSLQHSPHPPSVIVRHIPWGTLLVWFIDWTVFVQTYLQILHLLGLEIAREWWMKILGDVLCCVIGRTRTRHISRKES